MNELFAKLFQQCLMRKVVCNEFVNDRYIKSAGSKTDVKQLAM